MFQLSLNTVTTIYPNMLNIGLTVERLVEELEDKFPPVQPNPDTPINQIMYRSGQCSIVDWIRERIKEP